MSITIGWRHLAAILAVSVPISYIAFLGMLNSLGPSTEFIDPQIETAKPCGRELPCVYVGDDFYLRYYIVRHALNGRCKSDVRRYAVEIGGANNGRRHLLSHVELNFVGRNEIIRPRWPTYEERYKLEYSVDENNNPLADKPLLADGVDEQEMCFLNTNRYYCNVLDYIVPRYMQGGTEPDESPRICAIVRRHKEAPQ